MSTETKLLSTVEPLPSHIQALLDLTREVQGGTKRGWYAEYSTTLNLVLVYSLIAISYYSAEHSSVTVLFFATVAIMFSLHVTSERKARERLKLVLEVLRQQQSEQRKNDGPASKS